VFFVFFTIIDEEEEDKKNFGGFHLFIYERLYGENQGGGREKNTGVFPARNQM